MNVFNWNFILQSNLTHLPRSEFVPGIGLGIAKCPYDPLDNSTAVYVENGNPGDFPALVSRTKLIRSSNYIPNLILSFYQFWIYFWNNNITLISLFKSSPNYWLESVNFPIELIIIIVFLICPLILIYKISMKSELLENHNNCDGFIFKCSFRWDAINQFSNCWSCRLGFLILD